MNLAKSVLNRVWPALPALVLLWGLILVKRQEAIGFTYGQWVYALDDPYIHLSIAQNLLQHGAWGVNAGEFVSCSSSIAWPLMLAAIGAVGGLHVGLPFWLNALAASALVGVAATAIGWNKPRWVQALGALWALAIVFLTPLHALPFSGMEHAWHALVTLAFALCVARLTSRSELPSFGRWGLAAMALAALATSARYEGMFLVAVAAALLAWRRRWALAAGVAVAGALPIVAFGLYALAHHGEFLPNSVLLKGNDPAKQQLNFFLTLAWQRLWLETHLRNVALALVVLGLLGWRRKAAPSPGGEMTRLALGAIALHALFARYGWFFRYEAYVMALGLTAFGMRAAELAAGSTVDRNAHMRWLGTAVCGVALASATMGYGVGATRLLGLASKGIYDQHIQMARFLATYYPDQTVMVNDIGAVSYFANRTYYLDLWGLGTPEVLHAIREKRLDAAFVDELCRSRHARIAIVYDSYFKPVIPSRWRRVGTWYSKETFTNGSPEMSFYAIDPAADGPLKAQLRAFAPSLPPSVSTDAGPPPKPAR